MKNNIPIIGLLTDFHKDYYQAVMKGIIYSHHPHAKITDIPISTQYHTTAAAWALYWTYKYFPKRTMFLIVVDPGVGTNRRILLAKTNDYLFVAPDNSILAPIIDEHIKEVSLYEIPVVETASNTFHGRDVFAPIIGKLIKDYPKVFTRDYDFTSIGKRTYKYFRYEEEFISQLNHSGRIVYIDDFGNLVTNIRPLKDVPMQSRYLVMIPPLISRRMGFYETFEKGEEERPFLIIGSCNTFEIVMKRGSAAEYYKNYIEPGDYVAIRE